MQYAQQLKMRVKIFKSNGMNYSCHGSDAGKDFSGLQHEAKCKEFKMSQRVPAT